MFFAKNKMASTVNRSSFINLYSVEDVADDSFKFQIENKQAKVAISGSAMGEYDFPAYKFKKLDDSVFDLEDRFVALESATGVADNAAAIAQLQNDLAGEVVNRQSGDVANSNLITAEVSNRTSADQSLQANIDAEAAIARAAEASNLAAIQTEQAERISAVSNENGRALAAEAALGVRIDNLLSNTNAPALDSLAELVTAYESADSSLGNSIVAALARITVFEQRLDELTNS